jgi:hypothetical protein
MNKDGTDPILERARRLGEDIPPARDLWPEIRARIEEDRARAGQRQPRGWNAWVPAALAASVVVAVGVVAIVRGTGPEIADPGAGGPRMPVAATPASFGPSYTLGAKYQEARASLAGDLEERLAGLPAETREIVARNLEAIQAAVTEINAALASDPGNIFLQQLLLDTYHDELAVLANVRRMTETLPNTQRNEI